MNTPYVMSIVCFYATFSFLYLLVKHICYLSPDDEEFRIRPLGGAARLYERYYSENTSIWQGTPPQILNASQPEHGSFVEVSIQEKSDHLLDHCNLHIFSWCCWGVLLCFNKRDETSKYRPDLWDTRIYESSTMIFTFKLYLFAYKCPKFKYAGHPLQN